MVTVTVMHAGMGLPFTTTGSNCHSRIASTIAWLNGGNDGVSFTLRVAHTLDTRPFASSKTSPTHNPLPRVPAGRAGYRGLTSRVFFGARIDLPILTGVTPTIVEPSR
jgi:hypothetical protein